MMNELPATPMTSPLSPEAVAQMVADLTEADKPLLSGIIPFSETRVRIRNAADMITTLAAENATLRASEAAAMERLRVMADAVGELGDDLTYFPELTKHNLHQRAYDIALAALTPTADKE